MKILDLLKLTKRDKLGGIWLSGKKGEGEFKDWHDNGQLWCHSNWRNDRKNGEWKSWWSSGGLYTRRFFIDDNLDRELKNWDMNGEITSHQLWDNGKLIEDYLE